MQQLWISRKPILNPDSEIVGYELDLPEGFLEQYPDFFQPIGHDRAKSALYRLARHKRIDGGENRINFVLNDIAAEIAAFPVYAVSIALREIKREDSPFMPNIGEIYQRISFATRIRKREAERSPEPESKPPTRKQKIRVRRMCRIAAKPAGFWSPWERKFMAFYKTKETK